MLDPMNLRSAMLCATLVFASCAGGGTTLGCGGRGCLDLPPPSTPCPVPGLAPDPTLTLISPARGATGVPVTVGTITFSGTYAYATAFVVPHDGTLPLTGLPVTVSNGVDSITVPVLHAGVTYDVQPVPVPITLSPDCTVNTTQTAGSFTT